MDRTGPHCYPSRGRPTSKGDQNRIYRSRCEEEISDDPIGKNRGNTSKPWIVMACHGSFCKARDYVLR